ncbi:MAG TPA: DHA2 family efflux MFS transporter permease subunit [Micromonosporaceae bacterium]|jgi:EmrB/QacA subfamily drug resistance transporter
MSAPARRLGPAALFVLIAGSLLSMIDSNVVNVAIPDLSRELHGTLTSVQWTVSGYLLALAGTLPAAAFLAKRFGTIRVYGLSLAAFTLASVACALAQNVPELIAARAVQGVAAAPLVPLSMNLLFGQAGAGEGNLPVSAGIVFFLGPALGPTVGGLLISIWSWPAIFLINAPIGAAALLALPSLRRNGFVDETDPAARFDPVGMLLLSTGLVVALYGCNEGPTHGWWSASSGPYWSVGLLFIGAYATWARRRTHPAVDLRLLRNPQSALAVWLCLLTAVAMFSVLFLLPVLIQSIQGHGPLESGLVLLPQGLVMGLSTKVGMGLTTAGRLRPGIIAGLVAVGATTALLLLTTVDTPLWLTALIMAGRGLGIGLVIQPLLIAMLAGMSSSQLADANTVFNVGQRLGGSIGVSLLATFFTVRVAAHIENVLGPVRVGVGSLASAPPALRARLADAALSGFHDAIVVVVAVAALGVVFALFLRPTGPTAVGSDPGSAGDELHHVGDDVGVA